jgi:predicted secreted Zn-dependent protease
MNGRSLLTILAAVVCSCATPGRAEDNVTVTTNYYTGSGATARELRASLAQARPWKDSDTRDGQTQWNVQWSFELSETENGCRLRSLTTKTTITITLPRWSAPPSASKGLIERWKNYYVALQQHETRHAEMAREAAAEIRKRVTALRDPSSCEKFKESINATANKVVADFREQEIQFDKRTDHGRKDGAWFP